MTREDAERTVDLARFIQEGADRRMSPTTTTTSNPQGPDDDDPNPR